MGRIYVTTTCYSIISVDVTIIIIPTDAFPVYNVVTNNT